MNRTWQKKPLFFARTYFDLTWQNTPLFSARMYFDLTWQNTPLFFARTYFDLTRHRGEGGAGGALAPPLFWLIKLLFQSYTKKFIALFYVKRADLRGNITFS